jgi:hypothetical protein
MTILPFQQHLFAHGLIVVTDHANIVGNADAKRPRRLIELLNQSEQHRTLVVAHTPFKGLMYHPDGIRATAITAK